MSNGQQRERLGSRLGFLLISAGCAIGLGNVWRFPYIAGEYGGAAFVLVYLLFLLFLAMPIMVMEFSVGRASRLNIARAFRKLQPKHKAWQNISFFMFLGNYLLMMFYTTVSGWMLAYCWYTASGQLAGLSPDQVGAFFGATLESPLTQVGWMLAAVVAGFAVCYIGLRKGVERFTTIMMSGLFLLIIVLVVRSVTLEGAEEGLKFYLMPDFSKLTEKGLGTSLYAAMGQAFFTLSIGVGSMAIFGSYLGHERSLTGESLNIVALDTFAAVMSGLIIFPACFAFNVSPGEGPGLIFVTLPNVFNQMSGGIFWGTLFFVFMSFAAMSTVIAVFENIVAFGMDAYQWTRQKSVLINAVLLAALSLPCALGFNAWGFSFYDGNLFLDLEDFLLSNNILPLGSLVLLIFCTRRYGWGWDKFVAEADQGKGLKFPKLLRPYFTYVLPAIMLFIFAVGYYEYFRKLF